MTAAKSPSASSGPTRERPDDDPHLWLEEIDGAEAVTWVEARNAETLARYADAAFARDRDIAQGLLDRPERIPHAQRYGSHLYNFWKDAEHPRGLWRCIDEAGYRAGSSDWTCLLDLDALAADEDEDWIWAGATILPGPHGRALLRLSRGGSDAVVLREFDLAGLAFVPDGFVLPEAKSSAAWLDRDTLLLSSALGAGMATRSGYARTVRLWPRGADPQHLAVLFETAPEHMAVWGSVDRSDGTERVVVAEHTGFFDAEVHIGDRRGAFRRLDLPADAGVQLHLGRLSVRQRRPWAPVIRRTRASRATTRLVGRRPHSLHPGRALHRDRRRPRAPLGLWRLPGLAAADLSGGAGQALARARWHERGRQHPWGRRVRHPLARGQALRG